MCVDSSFPLALLSHSDLETMRDTLHLAEKEFQRKVQRVQHEYEQRLRQAEMASSLNLSGGVGAAAAVNPASLEEINNLETCAAPFRLFSSFLLSFLSFFLFFSDSLPSLQLSLFPPFFFSARVVSFP